MSYADLLEEDPALVNYVMSNGRLNSNYDAIEEEERKALESALVEADAAVEIESMILQHQQNERDDADEEIDARLLNMQTSRELDPEMDGALDTFLDEEHLYNHLR